MDLYARNFVGWSMQPTLTRDIVLDALVMAVWRRKPKQRVKKIIYKTRDFAKADVFDYIEVFNNRTRRHSHLGGVSPEAFERATQRASGVS